MIPNIADGIAGFVDHGLAAQQVVADADVVGGGRIAPAEQPVEVIVGKRDALAVAFADAGDIAVGVVAQLFEVGRRRSPGRGFETLE